MNIYDGDAFTESGLILAMKIASDFFSQGSIWVIPFTVFPLHGLAQTWPLLLLLGAAGGLFYAATMWLGMHDEDREFIRTQLARGPWGK